MCQAYSPSRAQRTMLELIVIKICDKDGNCCETGNGLDNRGNDREKGDTDTYTDATNLATCAEKVIDM